MDIVGGGTSGQVEMDQATLSSFHARINADKKLGPTPIPARKRTSPKSAESVEDSDEEESEEEEEEESEEEDEEGEMGIGDKAPTSAQSDDLDGSESDQSRSRDIFDQFKHQYNQEMVSRIYGSAPSEEEGIGGGGRESRGSGDDVRSRPASRLHKKADGSARSKSRPSTAHHSGRSGGNSAWAGSSGYNSRNPAMPSLRGSFEDGSQFQSEAHPGKGMKPPIIVSIKPKESW